MPDVYRYAHSSRFRPLGRCAPVAVNSGLRPETRCAAGGLAMSEIYSERTEETEKSGANPVSRSLNFN